MKTKLRIISFFAATLLTVSAHPVRASRLRGIRHR
jgi:hypothetical protein